MTDVTDVTGNALNGASWRRIEVVITSRTRNAVVGQPARGFESHRLRTKEQNTNGVLFFVVVFINRQSAKLNT